MRAIALLCCAAVSLSACQKSAEETVVEKAIEKSTGQQVEVDRDRDRNGERITIRSEAGEMKMTAGAALPLPANFPKDVYLPRDYKVASLMETSDAMMVALNAPGDVQTLFAAASEDMQRQGWKQVMKMQGDAQSGMLVYEKDKRTASMTLSTDNDQVAIALHLAAQK